MVISRNLIWMSESSPFIFGGMTKTEGFEVCPNRGENRR